MNKNVENKSNTTDLEIKCAACNSIPDSTGMTVEAEDYILHFCGEECYAYWRKKHLEKNKTELTGDDDKK